MAISYKPEQQQVISCQNKNQLVSASAGSGKTTIMIQKIIDLITKEGVSIKNILVLTYTKASAEEMKQKLVSAIYEEVKTNPNLFQQIDIVETADISTIHSFFQKVIKKYFMVLGINPAFDIIDETRGVKLQNRALDEAIAQYEKINANGLFELLECYGQTRTTKGLKDLVKDLNRFLLAVPNAQKWCEEIATSQYLSLENNMAVKILNDQVFFATQSFCKVLIALQIQAKNLQEEKYYQVCANLLSSLTCIKPDPQSFFVNCNIWLTLPKTRLVKNADTIDLYNQISEVKKDISDFAKKIKGWEFADKQVAQKQMKQIQKTASWLCEITQLYQKIYQTEKAKENVLDYDDLEKYMLTLIEDPKICEEIRSGYLKIFVDEYQDANRVQEKIISTIAKDNNRFMVGDVKQSIYGFRQAEPDIFLETLENFSKNQKSEVGFLNYNFRSHFLILNFVNFVFSKIMTQKTSKISYGETSMFKWDNVYQIVEGQNLPNVEINIIQKPEKIQLEVPTKMYSVLDENKTEKVFSDAQLEAFFVAGKINSLLGKKIFVAKEKRFREIENKDITILIRSRGKYLDEFCAVLTGLGVPLFANTNSSLFDDSDVMLLFNLLKLSVNFYDDIALVSVMHSPFGGFDFDELAKIRLCGAPKAAFWQCTESFAADQTIVQKIQTLKNFLVDFANDCKIFGLYLAFQKILDKANFFVHVLRKSDGFQKKEKVQKFLNDFLSNGFNFDVLGFLEFVENNKADISAPNYLGGENCVSITTIHSSKGLEYPVVILANANQDFDRQPPKTEIKLNQQLGIGLKFYDHQNRCVQSSLVFEAIKRANKNSDFAEKLRLLYVALTRPQNHLIVVGTAQKLNFQAITSDFKAQKQKSYLQLMLGCLKQEQLEQINFGQSIETDEFVVNVVDEFEKGGEAPQMSVGDVANDLAIDEMNKYFDFCPPKSVLPLFNSVTKIRQQNDNVVFDEVENSSDISIEVGNAYHKALELLDFEVVGSVDDVKVFLQNQNAFDAKLVCPQKIFDAINQIKSLGKFSYFKEQPFAMLVSRQELGQSEYLQKVFVKGVIDLLCVGQKTVIVDYKYTTQKSSKKIVEKYRIQLDLYQKALQKTGQFEEIEKYLLLIERGELIKIE